MIINNPHWILRKNIADRTTERISDLTQRMLLVGSCAYNPSAVTEKSDVDIICVMDFSKTDFDEFYFRISQPKDLFLVRYATSGAINTVSVVWDELITEVGLHLWDISALQNTIQLKNHNSIFANNNFTRSFTSVSDYEILINLLGEELKIKKNPQFVDGGKILEFYPSYETDSHFYPGIQASNLLMDPKILFEKDKLFSLALPLFYENLRQNLKAIYGASNDAINLYNAHPLKMKQKMNSDLEWRLKHFF